MTRPDPAFWRGRRVFVTGHTGFKGSWLTLALHLLGAEVHALALPAETGRDSLGFLGARPALAGEVLADIRDPARLSAAVAAAAPEVVFHLAAQAIVAEGYRDPLGTFATNVTGTLNLLEAARACPATRAVIAVTSDKVYRNEGAPRAFRENDPLGGQDPYAASKAAAELAVAAWRHSTGRDGPAVCTVRAGNVIGGADFALHRILPDIARAAAAGEVLSLRNPEATRPFQYVGDVLRGYLLAAEALIRSPGSMPPAINFGPQGRESTVMDLVRSWEAATGKTVRWERTPVPAMPECPRLALDSSLAGEVLGWVPDCDTASGIARSAAWYGLWTKGAALAGFSRSEAAQWLGLQQRVAAA